MYKPRDILRIATNTGKKVRVVDMDMPAGAALVHTVKNVRKEGGGGGACCTRGTRYMRTRLHTSAGEVQLRTGACQSRAWAQNGPRGGAGEAQQQAFHIGGRASSARGHTNLARVHAVGAVPQVLWPANSLLELPPPSGDCVHVVKAGDTLFQVAKVRAGGLDGRCQAGQGLAQDSLSVDIPGRSPAPAACQGCFHVTS